MPPVSGMIRPAVSPKEWNTGSTLNTLSSPCAATRVSDWMALASMLRCESTTPFGVPSLPEVNNIAAGSVACRGDACAWAKQAAQLIESGDTGANVFEIDHGVPLVSAFSTLAKPSLLDKAARGEDNVDVGGFAGSLHVGRARCEIEHGGHFAERLQCKERHGHTSRIWQHHADIRLSLSGLPSLRARTWAPVISRE